MDFLHSSFCILFFFFNDTATTEIYTLSLQTLFRSLPVGPDYVLGPGDSVSVNLWGSISQRLQRVEIGRDTSELQSPVHLVCRLLLEKKKNSELPLEPDKRPHEISSNYTITLTDSTS